MRRRCKPIKPARLAAMAAAAFAALRLLSAVGSGGAGAFAEFLSREGTAELILSLELPPTRRSGGDEAFYVSFLPGRSAETVGETSAGGYVSQPVEPEVFPEDSVPPPLGPPAPHRAAPPTASDSAPPPDGAANPPPPSYSENGGDRAAGVAVKNNSGLDFDVSKLLSSPLEIRLKAEGPSVLIIHTHSSEAYTRAPGETYEESDSYRTEDREHSIVRVGDELAAALSERGIAVVHDRELYDYPSYAGSYGRSLEASKRHIEKYPSIKLVIDLHRDAITAADGSQYKTIADINGELCSQIMLVVGTNSSGLSHPGWRDNLKLALRLQGEMNERFPTLARPVTVAKHRYNQHLTPGSLIVEVGAAGNTLSESLASVRYFAEAYAAVVEECS